MTLRQFKCADCGLYGESVGMPLYCLDCHFKNYNPKTGKYDLEKESKYYQKKIRSEYVS